jgi:oligopeptide/dipeptide ABC transporter ATP-binding protein
MEGNSLTQQTLQQSDDILYDVKDLKKYFPIKKGVFKRIVGHVQAVDRVNFSVPTGKTIGLVGESGCGKTTIGRCLLNLIQPSSGEIWFKLNGQNGKKLSEFSPEEMHYFRKQAQIVFQDPYSSLNPAKTIYETLDEPLRVFGVKRKHKREQRMEELLTSVNMRPEYVSRYPHQFSGGQRQRIVLARSLTVDPVFLLCDEPVSALDVSVQTQVLNLLRRIQRERNLTMVFIAHDLKVVEYMSDDVAVMYLGKVVEQFPVEKIQQTVHPYTCALISAVPKADPKTRGEERIILPGEVPDPSNPPSGCRFHPRCPLREQIKRGEKNGDAETCVHKEPQWRQVAPNHFTACHWFEEQYKRG